MKRSMVLLAVVAMITILAGCAPLPGSNLDEADSLTVLQLPDTRTIPAEWGSLARSIWWCLTTKPARC